MASMLRRRWIAPGRLMTTISTVAFAGPSTGALIREAWSGAGLVKRSFDIVVPAARWPGLLRLNGPRGLAFSSESGESRSERKIHSLRDCLGQHPGPHLHDRHGILRTQRDAAGARQDVERLAAHVVRIGDLAIGPFPRVHLVVKGALGH